MQVGTTKYTKTCQAWRSLAAATAAKQLAIMQFTSGEAKLVDDEIRDAWRQQQQPSSITAFLDNIAEYHGDVRGKLVFIMKPHMRPEKLKGQVNVQMHAQSVLLLATSEGGRMLFAMCMHGLTTV